MTTPVGGWLAVPNRVDDSLLPGAEVALKLSGGRIYLVRLALPPARTLVHVEIVGRGPREFRPPELVGLAALGEHTWAQRHAVIERQRHGLPALGEPRARKVRIVAY